MIYIGVDPGKSGGWAVIQEDREPVACPWDDRFFVSDMQGVVALAHERGEKVVACVERVGAMPGQGVTSMFNFGKSAGYIEGVLEALGISYQLVMPKRWKAEFTLNGKDKAASIEVCKRLFPGVELRATPRCRKDSDGMAEALLIACFAQRHF